MDNASLEEIWVSGGFGRHVLEADGDGRARIGVNVPFLVAGSERQVFEPDDLVDHLQDAVNLGHLVGHHETRGVVKILPGNADNSAKRRVEDGWRTGDTIVSRALPHEGSHEKRGPRTEAVSGAKSWYDSSSADIGGGGRRCMSALLR